MLTVDIIISAFNKPKELLTALESVYKQSYKKWKVIIIGDCCKKSFINKISPLPKNVKFINLPVRVGNQYGPNSLGMYLSKSDIITFLNHDDVWLSDHLENLVYKFQKEKPDIFFSKAAFCHNFNLKEIVKIKKRLVFSEINKPHLYWRIIHSPFYIFEPASAIAISSSYAKKIGYWNRPEECRGFTPLVEWLQRCIIFSKSSYFENKITVIKLNLHHNHNSINFKNKIFSSIKSFFRPHYFSKRPYSDLVYKLLNQPADDVRQNIESDLNNHLHYSLLNRSHTLPNMEDVNIKKIFLKIKNHSDLEKISNPNPFDNISLLRNRTGEKFKVFLTVSDLIKKYENNIKKK